MSGKERRNEILHYLSKADRPVSGTILAEEFGVSRQVIVQDIARIRSGNVEILSTNRGYLLPGPIKKKPERIYKCRHTDEQAEDELNCMVDQGGTVETVFVNHKVYGRLQAKLNIRSRRDVKEFVKNIHSGKSSLLKNITSNYHYHKVTAEEEEILDVIEKELADRGYLILPTSEKQELSTRNNQSL